MNIVDKAIAFFSPEKVLKRQAARRALQFLNTGYSESGASSKKKSVKGWRAKSSSPQADIDANLDTLRQRSRDLFMSGAIGRSAIVTPRTNVIGPGLKLKSRIDYKYLGLTREQADQWERNTEREFSIWAESRFCDTLRLNNFYELQSILFISYLLNGDGWSLIKQADPESFFPYSLRLHLIEADRVSTPKESGAGLFSASATLGKNPENGNRIYNGVEVDGSGAVVAYWISNGYPGDPVNPTGMMKWQRVEAFGVRTGRPNVLQIMEAERCEQYRGVPFLAPVLEAVKQISRYTEAELMAAIITGFFTVFIKESQSQTVDFPLIEAIPGEEKVDLDPNAFELGAGTINTLPPGYDVSMADPNRPSSNFDAFVTVLARHIGAALEMPYELLLKSFTASYSASRAALLEAWKSFRMRRTWFASDFCQPVYELWLDEAIARGVVTAPGYFNSPATAKAWSKAEWHGPAPGQIDPVKEVKAAQMRVDSGFSTRERETIEITGGDFDKNIEQLQRENELMKQAGLLEATSGGESDRHPVIPTGLRLLPQPPRNSKIIKPSGKKNEDKLPEVKQVIKTLSKEDKAELGPRYFYDDSQYRYIVERDDKPVGFIENRATGKKGHFNLAVDPDYRGQGIADEMVDQAITDVPVEMSNLEKILWITSEGNEASRKLAEKHGFELTSEEDGEVRYTYWLNGGGGE